MQSADNSSYDVFIGMHKLEAHRVKIDCYNKNFECLDEEDNLKVVKGIPKVISVAGVQSADNRSDHKMTNK